MLKLYEQYYTNPNESNLIKLWDQIKEFNDFDCWEPISLQIKEIRDYYNYDVESSQLNTNGSVPGGLRSYTFGANFNKWLDRIERYLRTCGGLPGIVIHLNDSNDVGKTIQDAKELRINNREKNVDCSLTCSILHLNHMVRLNNLLKNEVGNIFLMSYPLTWLRCSFNDYMTTFVFNNVHNLRLVNADYECWVKTKFREKYFINDQMIDWFTGLNFYTCYFGNKHTLPIFCQSNEGCTYLLNQTVKGFQKCDDHFVINNTFRCKCGKTAINLSFIAHQFNHLHFDRQIIDRLHASYLNLQFVEHDDKLHILYVIDRHNEFDVRADKEEIEKTANRPCFFHKNKVLRVGAKNYSFWKETRESLDLLDFNQFY